MDYKEIIESGKLELYALGALDAVEEQSIANLLQSNTELMQEYTAIANALGVYGKATSEVAPIAVLQKAKQQIEQEEKNEKAVEVIPMRAGNRAQMWAIAASVFLLASVGLNLKLGNDLSKVKQQYVALENQNQQMAANTVKLNQYNEETNKLIADISGGTMSRVYMGSTENFEGYESAVYWDKNSGKAILATNKLPTLSENEQYQLWAIVDGKPVDAGVFNPQDRIVQMLNIQGTAVAFAVTIEPKGGSVNPTTDKMVMLGNVES